MTVVVPMVDPAEALARADAGRERRGQRYALRRWLWEHSSFSRTRQCGRVLRTDSNPKLRIAGTPGKDAIAGVAGLVTCGQRFCPVCAPKIGARRAQEIIDILRVHRDKRYYPDDAPHLGGGAILLTLTVRHNRDDELAALLDVLAACWSSVTRSGSYVVDVDNYDLAGWIRALDLTWSRVNHHHPHYHVLVLTKVPVSPQMAWMLGWRIYQRWAAALGRRGESVLAEYGLDVKVCDLDDMSTGALGDYLTKVGREVASGHTKAGRVFESYTVLGLLEEVSSTYEYAAFQAWRELEAALGGTSRKFVTFSRNPEMLELRAEAGREREQSDEQVAAEELGSPDLVEINRNDWKKITRVVDELLNVAETDGVDAATAWLTVRGVRWAQRVSREDRARLNARHRTVLYQLQPSRGQP